MANSVFKDTCPRTLSGAGDLVVLTNTICYEIQNGHQRLLRELLR